MIRTYLQNPLSCQFGVQLRHAILLLESFFDDARFAPEIAEKYSTFSALADDALLLSFCQQRILFEAGVVLRHNYFIVH